MSKSLEALDRLYDGYQYGMAGRSFYDLIKQDLERLEQLKKIFGDSHICEIQARFNEI